MFVIFTQRGQGYIALAERGDGKGVGAIQPFGRITVANRRKLITLIESQIPDKLEKNLPRNWLVDWDTVPKWKFAHGDFRDCFRCNAFAVLWSNKGLEMRVMQRSSEGIWSFSHSANDNRIFRVSEDASALKQLLAIAAADLLANTVERQKAEPGLANGYVRWQNKQ